MIVVLHRGRQVGRDRDAHHLHGRESPIHALAQIGARRAPIDRLVVRWRGFDALRVRQLRARHRAARAAPRRRARAARTQGLPDPPLPHRARRSRGHPGRAPRARVEGSLRHGHDGRPVPHAHPQGGRRQRGDTVGREDAARSWLPAHRAGGRGAADGDAARRSPSSGGRARAAALGPSSPARDGPCTAGDGRGFPPWRAPSGQRAEPRPDAGVCAPRRCRRRDPAGAPRGAGGGRLSRGSRPGGRACSARRRVKRRPSRRRAAQRPVRHRGSLPGTARSVGEGRAPRHARADPPDGKGAQDAGRVSDASLRSRRKRSPTTWNQSLERAANASWSFFRAAGLAMCWSNPAACAFATSSGNP